MKKSLTTAYFKQSGKIPEDKGLFYIYIWVKRELMNGEHIFISLVGIPSYPEEFLCLRDFIMFSIALVDMDFKLIFGKGFLQD